MQDITPEIQTERLWAYLKGFHAVHLINVGVKLGLFAELHEAADGIAPGPLAAALGLHEPYVEVWCNTACAYGLLDAAADGGFRLAPHFDELLVEPGNPRLLAPYFTASIDHLGADMARYPEFFRSGDTFTFQEHGEDFSRAISEITDGFHTVVARRILPALPGLEDKLEGGVHILDMGCGAGGLLLKIARAMPNSTCVGVDVDAHGVKAARENIEAARLGDRVTVERLDGAVIGHQDEFDVVTLFEVLHELPLDVRPRVIANAHQALKPAGTLLIIDETYPSKPEDLRKPEYGLAVQTAFNEVIWGNVVPTKEDQDALLTEAGFAHIRRQPIAGIFTMITAEKAGP